MKYFGTIYCIIILTLLVAWISFMVGMEVEKSKYEYCYDSLARYNYTTGEWEETLYEKYYTKKGLLE